MNISSGVKTTLNLHRVAEAHVHIIHAARGRTLDETTLSV